MSARSDKSQLGVGSIGALVSHHLRLSNPSASISLITKRATAFGSTRLYPHGKPGKPLPTIQVEREGTISTSSNYEVEVWHNGEAERRLFSRALPDIKTPIDLADMPNGDIRSLIVCLKTTDTIDALSILRPRISPSSVITLIQNGMGVFDELCQEVWPDPAVRPNFILGTTTHGAKMKPGPGKSIQHATKPGSGDIKFGIVPDPRNEVNFERWLWGAQVGTLPILSPPSSPTFPLSPPPPASIDMDPMRHTLEALLSMSQLSPGLLPMPHLHHQLLLKLAINSVINPLTAVVGGGAIPNGALFGTVPAHRLIHQLAQETADTISAYLHSLNAPHAPPPDVARLFNRDSLIKRILAVVRSTAENISSMATDVSHGKVTEIRHINGYLIDLGRRYGVSMPKHRMIYDMVKFTSELNGLSENALDSVKTKVVERRKFLRAGYIRSRDLLTPKQIELEERKMQLEEEKLWLAKEQIKEDRSTRRQLKEARASEKIKALAEMAKGQDRPSWHGMNRRDRQRIKREAAQRSKEDRVSESAPSLSEFRHGNAVGNTAIDADRTLPNATEAILPSAPSSSDQSTPSSPSLPSTAGPLRSWMDAMISSAPRQERTWEVPSVPPTARGPRQKKRDQSKETSKEVSGSAPTKDASPAPSLPPATSSGSLTDMMSTMINAAPRQSPLDATPPSPSSSPPSSPPFIPRVTSSTSPSSPFSSSMDSLISSAPRAERSWDTKGGTISGYTGASPVLATTIGKARIQGQDLSRGGLGTSLDSLIAGAPRQERTWDVRSVAMDKSDKGKFTTSRSSGS